MYFLSSAEENITAAKTIVHGKIGPVWIPFSVDEPNACKDQGIVCPMTAGKEYTFKTVLPIKALYPSVCMVLTREMFVLMDILNMNPVFSPKLR